MRRLAVLGVSLEANTFSSVKTTEELIRADGGFHAGAEMVAQYEDSTATLGGFLDPEVPDDVELVPLVGFASGARGEFTAGAFDSIVGQLLAALADGGPFDGVLLDLHGAAVAENHPDADAEVASRVRDAVGPDVPIGVVLDMHGNVGRRLVATVDVLRIYQTNPHVDGRERAVECRRLLLQIIDGRPRPVMVLERLPLVVNIVKQGTADQPLATILAHCREMEARPGIVDVSIAEGFPYADVDDMGMSVLVSHEAGDGADRAARSAAAEVADLLWRARADLQAGGVTPEDALRRVAAHAGTKPLLVLDVGDNVGAGSNGDSTTILNEAVRLSVGNFAIALHDPETVASLSGVAIGERVHVTVAGRSPEQEGHPQSIDAVLTGRSDGHFQDPGPTHGGALNYYGGPMVALRTDNDIAVVLTSVAMGTTSPELFRVVGVEPTGVAAIVAKGVNSPKAGFGPICSEHVMVDTPGVTRLSVERFDYHHRRHPLYPYEPDTTYAPGLVG